MRHQFKVASAVTIGGLLALPLAATAQDPAPPPVDFSGTYTLAQVDDTDLPVQFDERENCRHEVIGATLTINADNTWNIETQVRETCGEMVNEETTTEEGNFEVTAEGIDFDPGDPAQEVEPADDVDIDELATGTMAEGELRVRLEDAPDRVLVFRRQ